MKVGFLGAGSVRSPLLVRTLAGSDLPIDTLALYDVDGDRLALLVPIARRFAPQTRLQICERPEAAIEGASFVLTSLRVGGMEARALDEEASLELGLVGQETVGPAGFALALRNLPPMIAYARQLAKLAPDAFLINYTNPVGIVTQGVLQETGARAIGICDTPTELFAAAAAALELSPKDCRFDHVGLNHLGWLKEIEFGGRGRISEILESDAALRQVDPGALFEPAFLRELGLLPTEYLYYYYRTRDAVQALARARRPRGRYLAERNRDLFVELARETDPVPAYERYFEEREATYFSIESGRERDPAARPEGTGYDQIALSVMRAIHFDRKEVVPVNVRNGGILPELEPDDVVEVPAILDRKGAHPIPTSLPASVRDLVSRVKEYERRTVAASLSPSPPVLLDALASNPLVPDRETAETALARLTIE